MPDPFMSIDGVRVPLFLYGTAWKEDETRRLTELALQQGFPRAASTPPTSRRALPRSRGLDRASPADHRKRLADPATTTLFLQTKFTFPRGQDHRLPYDPAAPIATQVEQSFASSLEHLSTDFIDSYVLHGPSRQAGLVSDDWDAWRAMEAIHDRGHARLLGISNVSLEQLQSPLRAGTRPAPFCPEPLLRRPTPGTATSGSSCKCSPVGIALPGVLPADGQPPGAGPSRGRPDRQTPRPNRRPGRLPIRTRCRHAPPHRHHERRPHAGRPRRLRFPSRARRARPDRTSRDPVTPLSRWTW